MNLSQKSNKKSFNLNKLTLLIFIFTSLITSAQEITKEDLDKEIKPLTQKVKILQIENTNRKSEIGALNAKLKTANDSIEVLKQKLQENKDAISQTAEQLSSKIQETREKNEGKITEVSESLSKNSLYGIIGVLSAILLSGLLYWLLSRRQQTDKSDVEGQLSQTKKAIQDKQEETYKSLTQINESISKQNLKHSEVIQKLLEIYQNVNKETGGNEINHEFPLKVADEITLLERNVNLMDTKIKGHKQLLATVRKLKDNLSAHGYDMPELLGKAFDNGMKLIVSSDQPDENLEKGVEIISKVIKPIVNYNGVLIQTGEIERSIGY